MKKEYKDALWLILKIVLSTTIGLGIVIYLFRNEFKSAESIVFDKFFFITLILAFCLMCIRDLAFTHRFRVLCKPERLSFGGSLRANYMCEFVSAITPSAIGGSAMTMFYLNKEGISTGRASTIMFATLLLDELFLVIGCPVCFIFLTGDQMLGGTTGLFHAFQIAFILVYLLLLVYTIFLTVAIFFKPAVIQSMLRFFAKLPYIKKYAEKINAFAQEMTNCNTELRKKPFSFWLKAFLLTLIAWMARYMVVCVLLAPFIDFHVQGTVLARQFSIWIMQIISPTPGGSGFSEFLFSKYYSDLNISPVVILTAVCEWRIVTYYIYIMIGFILLLSYRRKKK